jgi:hypothetical protein
MYNSYAEVPWYRRSGINHLFAIVGLFVIPPLLWFVSIMCLSGDIYEKKKDANGSLKKWGTFSKVFSVLILIVQAFFILGAITKS